MTKNKQLQLLYIGEKKNGLDSLLRNTSQRMGYRLKTVRQYDALSKLRKYRYVVLFDDEHNLLALRKSEANSIDLANILFFSSSPNWKEAREVLMKGANYYAPTPSNQSELVCILSNFFAFVEENN